MTQAPLPPKVIVDVKEVVRDEIIESVVVVSKVLIAIIVKDSNSVTVKAVEVDDIVDAIDDADVDPIVDVDLADLVVDPDPVADPVDTVVNPEVDAVD